LQALADGVRVRPEALRHARADDHRARCALSIAIRDSPSAYDARTERREVFGADAVEVELAELLDRVDPGDVQTRAPHAPERDAGLPRRRLDLRKRLGVGQQLLLEEDRLRRIQNDPAQVELEDEHRFHVVPEPDVSHVVQAADEQPGSHEQHDRQRALKNEQAEPELGPVVCALTRARLEIAREAYTAELS